MGNEFTILVITYKMGWFNAPFHTHNHVGNIPYIKPYSIHTLHIREKCEKYQIRRTQGHLNTESVITN
jgi:hypothetical protein